MKPFVYSTSCTSADSDDILEMRNSGKQTSFIVFLRFCEIKEWAKSMGYVTRGKQSLAHDWHIRYFRGKYQEQPCFYLVHSGIEYIWLKIQSR